MSNIVPLKLRPHLVSYFMKELKGEERNYAGYRCKISEVSRKSFIGKYIIDLLEKSDYPVRNISGFNFFIEIKSSYRKVLIDGGVYKKEKLGDTFVYLPEEHVENVNTLFEEKFRDAFFTFVESREQENDLLITQAILLFIDKYDLFECGITQPLLRRLYYRMKNNGLCSGLQGKLYRD